MPNTYAEAEAAALIASTLIPNFHPELATARIAYVFVENGTKKQPWGKAQKMTGYYEWALETDFTIFVAQDKWNEANAEVRNAIIDHLLECCTGEEEDGVQKWLIRDHEIKEFSSILQRHGAWHEGLVGFVQVAKAVNLDGLIADEVFQDMSENSESVEVH